MGDGMLDLLAYNCQRLNIYKVCLLGSPGEGNDHVEKAKERYKEIVEKYPNSEYVNDSKYKIQVTRDQLAGKEMSIGRFYLHHRNYVAAINRFRTVLANYQTTRHTEEALYRLT